MYPNTCQLSDRQMRAKKQIQTDKDTLFHSYRHESLKHTAPLSRLLFHASLVFYYVHAQWAFEPARLRRVSLTDRVQASCI